MMRGVWRFRLDAVICTRGWVGVELTSDSQLFTYSDLFHEILLLLLDSIGSCWIRASHQRLPCLDTAYFALNVQIYLAPSWVLAVLVLKCPPKPAVHSRVVAFQLFQSFSVPWLRSEWNQVSPAQGIGERQRTNVVFSWRQDRSFFCNRRLKRMIQ